VSHIWSLTCFPRTFSIRNLKSTPIVDSVDYMNLLSMKRNSSEDLPTEELPTSTILIYFSGLCIINIKWESSYQNCFVEFSVDISFFYLDFDFGLGILFVDLPCLKLFPVAPNPTPVAPNPVPVAANPLGPAVIFNPVIVLSPSISLSFIFISTSRISLSFSSYIPPNSVLISCAVITGSIL
jgi:hypothetical protein